MSAVELEKLAVGRSRLRVLAKRLQQSHASVFPVSELKCYVAYQGEAARLLVFWTQGQTDFKRRDIGSDALHPSVLNLHKPGSVFFSARHLCWVGV